MTRHTKLYYFNPLPRKRENYRTTILANLSKDFNPLPRKRENDVQDISSLMLSHFNPLPRKRENDNLLVTVVVLRISIHSLVRGRTLF